VKGASPLDFLSEAKARFCADKFATEVTGIEIKEARKDYAKCVVKLTPLHMNANGAVMGGVLFTLADFAFAVASNTDNPPTVSADSRISFLTSAKGGRLTAETVCERSGRNICFYTVNIEDDEGRRIAVANFTGFRKTAAS
jgi:acyl-CoA thioesterase